jgi:hypothetical protein
VPGLLKAKYKDDNMRAMDISSTLKPQNEIIRVDQHGSNAGSSVGWWSQRLHFETCKQVDQDKRPKNWSALYKVSLLTCKVHVKAP